MTVETRTIVCFDLGGVLIRICRSWDEACANARIETREGYADPDITPARRALVREFDTGKLTPDDFFTAISRTLKGLYSPEEIRTVHDAWLLGEYPGAADCIEELSAQPNITTACLSNTNQAHWSHIARSPAISALHHTHASHLLAERKPDEAIYIAFEKAMNTTPDRIIFFDDLPENIAAATARGWNANHIDHTSDPIAQIRETLGQLSIL